jgi:hypothetical protein
MYILSLSFTWGITDLENRYSDGYSQRSPLRCWWILQKNAGFMPLRMQTLWVRDRVAPQSLRIAARATSFLLPLSFWLKCSAQSGIRLNIRPVRVGEFSQFWFRYIFILWVG